MDRGEKIDKMKKKSKKNKFGFCDCIRYMNKEASKNVPEVLIYMYALIISSIGLDCLQMIILPLTIDMATGMANIFIYLSVIIGYIICSGGKAYFLENIECGRNTLRDYFYSKFIEKMCMTSYINMLNPEFQINADAVKENCTNKNYSLQRFWYCFENIIISLFGMVIYLFIMNRLNIGIILVIIFISVMKYMINKKARYAYFEYRDDMEASRRQIRIVNDIMMNIRVHKENLIFDIQNLLRKKLNEGTERLHVLCSKFEKGLYVSDSISIVLELIGKGISYIYLIKLIAERQISVSQGILAFSAVNGLSSKIDGVLRWGERLSRHCINVSYYREFLDYPEQFQIGKGKDIPDLTQGCCIELVNVSFAYEGSTQKIIHNINLRISAGEKIALVGLNGAGKTTLVKLVCGLLDPTEGAIYLNGQDIRYFNREKYYHVISAVFQEHFIFDSKRLSGGQIQKKMIERAQKKAGKILILDEPTASLDPLAEKKIYEDYNQISEGKITIFVSHRLASTLFCDRILYLENGCLQEDGTHEELMNAGNEYAKLYQIQCQYYT
jgi:ATP-binding cassette subfamily B protein